jgi:hypothetical protein
MPSIDLSALRGLFASHKSLLRRLLQTDFLSVLLLSASLTPTSLLHRSIITITAGSVLITLRASRHRLVILA